MWTSELKRSCCAFCDASSAPTRGSRLTAEFVIPTTMRSGYSRWLTQPLAADATIPNATTPQRPSNRQDATPKTPKGGSHVRVASLDVLAGGPWELLGRCGVVASGIDTTHSPASARNCASNVNA